jgi:hypothetical protein
MEKSLAHKIFSVDEIEDVIEQQEKRDMRREPDKHLSSIFGKDQLEEEYATEKDFKIKVADKPERHLRLFSEE